MFFRSIRYWRQRVGKLGQCGAQRPLGRSRPPLTLEVLEDRLQPSTFAVLTPDDAGPGSLRQALLDANATPGTDTIAFNIGGGGVQTIRPTSALPGITDPVVIDGTTQPGFAGSPLIVLNGGSAGPSAAGLRITAGNSTVRGLVINGFASDGIALSGSGGNIIAGNYIGTDVTGTAAVPNGGSGTFVAAPGNTIGGTAPGDRNVLSGNGGGGVLLVGAGNVVQGNYIGTDAAGSADLGNGTGVAVAGANNVIGGATAGARNVISGNVFGLTVNGDSTVIQGNYIGTDATGTRAVGNDTYGILLSFGAFTAVIGGTAPGEGNVISGNALDGINSSAPNIRVQGNLIGTDATGTAALGNGGAGIDLTSGFGATVGGTTPGARNVVSANRRDGIEIFTVNNRVQGNYIGTDVTGRAALGNVGSGVLINGATVILNVVGGTAAGAGNLISGNTGAGVFLRFAQNNRVEGNRIGTDVTGTAALGNQTGVLISGNNNTVGGTAAGAGNTISGNRQDGVQIVTGGSNTRVQGNFLGTDATGTQALGNGGSGVSITASGNTIGGAGAGNVISGNALFGIIISAANSTGNQVQGNYVGTDVTGTVALGNGIVGVFLDNTSGNAVGGTAPGAGNLISGNRGTGVGIREGTANRVQGNLIGTDVTGHARLGNRTGVFIQGGLNHLIGGVEAGARNIISGSTGSAPLAGFGIIIIDGDFGPARGHRVQGNYIGTDITGTQALGNNEDGVRVDFSSTNVIVGGTAPEARNVVSANGQVGVFVTSGSGNVVQGNYVGTDVTGTAALGNGDSGVIVGGRFNTVGGTTPGAGNLLSGNRNFGLFMTGAGHLVQGNFVGTDVTGTAAVPNGFGVGDSGVVNTIGGTTPGAGNVISGNATYGVRLLGFAGLVQGNFIGTDVTGTRALGNGTFGVGVDGGSDNVVGGAMPGARNIISANGTGISILTAQTSVQGNFIGTDVTGSAALGNGTGVAVSGSNNTIGGTAAGAGNTIAFNVGAGVVVQDANATGNRIQGNAIHSNAALGIDLGGDGVTPNDTGDADSGPNQLQNFPVLSVALAGGSTRVAGTVNSLANTTFTLDFYASAAADPSGFGEGARYLGSAVVTTDGSGNARFEVTLAAPTIPGEVVTATATDSDGNTSEFSRAALAYKEVAIDIKPGDAANLINLNSNGVLPVAVLTTPDFDAATVDTSDLSRIRFGDVNVEARVSPVRSALADVDGDGDLDLILHFSTREIRETGALTEASTLAELTGFTTGGIPWRGTDMVQVVRGEDGADSAAGPGGFDGLLLAALGTPAAPEGRAFRPGLLIAGQKDEPVWAPSALPAPGDAGADVPQMLVPDTMRRTSAQASSTAWLDLVFADFPGEDRPLDGAVGPTVS